MAKENKKNLNCKAYYLDRVGTGWTAFQLIIRDGQVVDKIDRTNGPNFKHECLAKIQEDLHIDSELK